MIATGLRIHTTRAARSRAVGQAAYRAALRTLHAACAVDAAAIARRAVRRYRSGECSAAMAITRAIHEARA